MLLVAEPADQARKPGRSARQPLWILRYVASALTAGLVALAHADDGPLSDINYRVGDGLRVPSLGLTLGGYATGTYEKLRDLPGRAALDSLSLSVWWEGAGRWKLFSEFDYENPISSRSARTGDEDRYLSLERFYVDYAVNELATARLGKFLTPVGRWNLIHAAPLVWTTSRPLVTTVAFPTNVTGLMISGTFPLMQHSAEYSIYGSDGDEVRPNPALDTFHEALGTRLVMPLSPNAQIGFSFVSFEQAKEQDVRKELYGADLYWSRHRFEVSAEVVYRVLHDPNSRNEGGGFIQFVAPLSERLYAVGRYEIYRETQQLSPTSLWVSGLSYRISPAIVFEAEWVASKHNDIHAPEGFLSSISILF